MNTSVAVKDAKRTRPFSFPTDTETLISNLTTEKIRSLINHDAKELYALYEQEFLYLPDDQNTDLITFLNSKYSLDRSRLSDLCSSVFNKFDLLVDSSSWNISEDDIYQFLRARRLEEIDLINQNRLSDDYASIASLENSKAICRYMVSQFSLDYLTEASPLIRLLPGTYGELQMTIFSMISDEYGNGLLDGKHSVLFQHTLRSLDMPDDVDFYRPHILPSIYMYMSYVNRITYDKRLFLRFLGFLYVYEVGLIYATQQQGLLLKEVFGDKADIRYFMLHVDIDQVHGDWVVERLLIPVIDQYGIGAAKEIMRGYHETLALLAFCDIEMKKQMTSGSFPSYCFSN